MTIAATGTWPEAASRTRDDGRIGDRRVSLEHGLDFGRRDVLAAAHDPVRPAVDDVQAAAVVKPPEVAGPDGLVGATGRLADVPLSRASAATTISPMPSAPRIVDRAR